MSLLLFLKGKALPEGTVRKWSTGTYKKVNNKWVFVSADQASEKEVKRKEKKVVSKKEKEAEQLFDYAVGTELGDVFLDFLTKEYEIRSFGGLKTRIQAKPYDEAHKMFKKVVDYIRQQPGTPTDKKLVLDFFGRSLLILRDYFSEKPKTKLTVKVTSKKGKEYYKKPEPSEDDLPVLKPSMIQSAIKKLGGWTVSSKLTTDKVKKMIHVGSATILSGKLDSKKDWVLPQSMKEIDLRYTGNTLGIIAKQVKKRKGKRDLVTAKVRIEIPYAFAKKYILSNVKKVRTRNNLLFRLEHSSGYRKFLEEGRN